MWLPNRINATLTQENKPLKAVFTELYNQQKMQVIAVLTFHFILCI